MNSNVKKCATLCGRRSATTFTLRVLAHANLPMIVLYSSTYTPLALPSYKCLKKHVALAVLNVAIGGLHHIHNALDEFAQAEKDSLK
jgi:hypothetical protein